MKPWRWMLPAVEAAELSLAGHKDRYDDAPGQPCPCGRCGENAGFIDTALREISARILAEVEAMKESE